MQATKRLSMLEKVLIQRDGYSVAEARAEAERARAELIELIESGDFMATEDYMADNYGLEPDYLEDLIL